MKLSDLIARGLKNPTAFLRLLLHLPKMLRLTVRLMRDQRVPLFSKALVVLSLVYLVSPLDLIPDFLFPVFGITDDLFVVMAAARKLLRDTPPEVLQAHIAEVEK